MNILLALTQISDESKNAIDVVLQLATMGAGAFAFCVSLRQWRRGQDWQRAEQMDKFIVQFEQDDLLKLAANVIDWTERKVTFEDSTLHFTNSDALLALRNHLNMDDPHFPPTQALLRDAYDSFLSLLERLELGISTGLIDPAPARQYFRYWLAHFLSFDRHNDDDGVLKGSCENDSERAPSRMVTAYIKTYGNLPSVQRLCKHFGLTLD